MENKKPKPTLKKLNDIEYKGEKKTFTQQLTNEQIIDLLDGYDEVPFNNLKVGYHLRYFKINDDGKNEFRLGGTIIKKALQYIVLTNGTGNWSVQKKGNIFYQQMPLSQVKAEIEDKYKMRINELMAYIKKLEKEIEKLKTTK